MEVQEEAVSGAHDSIDDGTVDDFNLPCSSQSSEGNSIPPTLSKGFDFEVINEEELVDFEIKMNQLIVWFKSPETRRTWPPGVSKSTFRKSTKYYSLCERTGQLFRKKKKGSESKLLSIYVVNCDDV